MIYVKDFLKEFGPDPLRYFIAVAGPENQDTDFTWDEFVRRINNELANGWGNLVNRVVSMAANNFGKVPTPGELTEADQKILDLAEQAFDVVGEALQHSRFKQGITHAMHVVGEANAYVAEMQPWKLAKAIKTAKAGAANAGVDSATDANTLLTPYIPNIAQQVHETLGRTGVWAAHPQVVEVADDMPADVVGVGVPQAGRTYPVIMGDYGNQQAVWRRTPVEPGTVLQKPKPLIAKLDPELGETGPKWAPVSGKA